MILSMAAIKKGVNYSKTVEAKTTKNKRE